MAKNKSLEQKYKRLLRLLGQHLDDFESDSAKRLLGKIKAVESALKIKPHKRIAS